MKSIVRLVTCAVMLLAVSTALAQPPGKGPQFRKQKSLQTVEDYESVKSGDTLRLVCIQCQSVSETKVDDSGEVMAYCVEGNEIICPVCEKKYKTVLRGVPGKQHAQKKVAYVNDEGKECVFMTVSVSEDETEKK